MTLLFIINHSRLPPWIDHWGIASFNIHGRGVEREERTSAPLTGGFVASLNARANSVVMPFLNNEGVCLEKTSRLVVVGEVLIRRTVDVVGDCVAREIAVLVNKRPAARLDDLRDAVDEEAVGLRRVMVFFWEFMRDLFRCIPMYEYMLKYKELEGISSENMG